MTVNVTTIALSVYPWKKRRMTDAFRCCFCGEYSPICLFRSGLSTLFFIFLFFSGPLLNLFTFCFAGSLHRHWKDGSCSDKSKVKRRGRAVMRVTEENSLSIIPTGMSILNNTTFFFFTHSQLSLFCRCPNWNIFVKFLLILKWRPAMIQRHWHSLPFKSTNLHTVLPVLLTEEY